MGDMRGTYMMRARICCHRNVKVCPARRRHTAECSSHGPRSDLDDAFCCAAEPSEWPLGASCYRTTGCEGTPRAPGSGLDLPPATHTHATSSSGSTTAALLLGQLPPMVLVAEISAGEVACRRSGAAAGHEEAGVCDERRAALLSWRSLPEPASGRQSAPRDVQDAEPRREVEACSRRVGDEHLRYYMLSDTREVRAASKVRVRDRRRVGAHLACTPN